jgi:hypothetical protein
VFANKELVFLMTDPKSVTCVSELENNKKSPKIIVPINNGVNTNLQYRFELNFLSEAVAIFLFLS